MAFEDKIAETVVKVLMDPIAQLGAETVGEIFWVIEDSDTDYSKILREHPDNVFNTVELAYAAMTTNRNDVCYVSANTTHTVAAMVTVSKSRVHFIGLAAGDKRLYGQRTRISMGVTSAATDLGTVLNTGVGNSFRNIKFMNSNTVTEGIYCFLDGGEYAYWENCEFYKETDLDQTGAAEFVWNGDSAQMVRCTIGSLANAIAGSSIIRPCILLTAGIAGAGKVCRDGYMEDCLLWRQTIATTNAFIWAANAADVERQLLLKGCGFICSKASTNIPAVCIDLDATLTVGHIILDPTCYASNVTKIATATGVIVTGAAVNSGAGIGVNAA